MQKPLVNVPDSRPDTLQQPHLLPKPPGDSISDSRTPIGTSPRPRSNTERHVDIPSFDMSSESPRAETASIKSLSPRSTAAEFGSRDVSPTRRELGSPRRDSAIRYESVSPPRREVSPPRREASPFRREISPIRSSPSPRRASVSQEAAAPKSSLPNPFPDSKSQKSHFVVFACGALFGRMPVLAISFLVGGAVTVFLSSQSQKASLGPKNAPETPHSPKQHSKPAFKSMRPIEPSSPNDPPVHQLITKSVPDRILQERSVERRRRRFSRAVDEEYAFRPYD